MPCTTDPAQSRSLSVDFAPSDKSDDCNKTMARHAADREDLFEEFRSTRAKWELTIPVLSCMLVCGIRRDDRLSLYFGPDQVYHFDQQNRLLRAYSSDHLFRTQGTTLAQLHRSRMEAETILSRHDLSQLELREFLDSCRGMLMIVHAALHTGSVSIIRMYPESVAIKELHARLDTMLQNPLKLAPAFRTRKD